MAKTAKQFTLVPFVLNGKTVGFTVEGPVMFADFAAERDGSTYTVYVDPETGKTVSNPTEEQKATLIAEQRTATPRREMRKNFALSTLVWDDGKVRDISFRLKANNPLTPAEFEAANKATAEKRALSTAKNLSTDAKRALLAELQAELAEDGEEPGE